MKIFESFELIKSDYLRLRNQRKGRLRILFHFSFVVSFWYRICHYISSYNNPLAKIILLFPYILNSLIQLITGIQIPRFTRIGKGICFMHHSCIVIAGDTIIGDYCSIHQGVTIGRSFSGSKAGCPIIGNNVIIYPGAKVIGKVHIGNNAIIGANAVVINDVPANCVVAGVPAKIINTNSASCINDEWKYMFFRN